jgi:hypothetical protein
MTEISVTSMKSQTDDSTYVTAKFRPDVLSSDYVVNGIVNRVCELIAERYVKENYPQLVAKLDQQAIANLVIAESGKKIAEEIRLAPPPPSVVKDTQVYQRGIFGGLRRVR